MNLNDQFEISCKCPRCHIEIYTCKSYEINNDDFTSENESIQIVVHKCPKCKKYFFEESIFNWNGEVFELTESKFFPKTQEKPKFSDEIMNISDEFIDIYQQAEMAYSLGLEKIAGPGYRKALEFLIKDFAVMKEPDNQLDIKSNSLEKIIKKYIEHPKIKGVARRASWIGNDEVHYVRIWKNKDINDLRNLIDMVIHYIDMEKLFETTMIEMAEKDKKSAGKE